MKSVATFKSTVKSVAQKMQNAKAFAAVAITAPGTLLISPSASALNRVNLTENTAGNQNLETVAANLDGAGQTMASLFINLVTIFGFVVVAMSIYTLWKASKDEREKPMPAIVGLFVGGAMAAVGTIMWIMKNTIVPV